jgi:Amt family ammonium transporter
VLSTVVYSGVMTLILLMVTKALVGLRVDQEEKRGGLDINLHGEQIF